MHSAVEQGVNRGQPNKVHLVWLVNLYSGKEYLAQTHEAATTYGGLLTCGTQLHPGWKPHLNI